jgi:hypothetical protein
VFWLNSVLVSTTTQQDVGWASKFCVHLTATFPFIQVNGWEVYSLIFM